MLIGTEADSGSAWGAPCLLGMRWLVASTNCPMMSGSARWKHQYLNEPWRYVHTTCLSSWCTQDWTGHCWFMVVEAGGGWHLWVPKTEHWPGEKAKECLSTWFFRGTRRTFKNFCVSHIKIEMKKFSQFEKWLRLAKQHGPWLWLQPEKISIVPWSVVTTG